MFPPAIARRHALRLAGLLALPVVLGALAALILRPWAAARWAIFQKLTLLLTGVLFIIYYHITSDPKELLWLFISGNSCLRFCTLRCWRVSC
jgi:hypothetical protein